MTAGTRVGAVALAVALLLAGCSGSTTPGSSPTDGSLVTSSPPVSGTPVAVTSTPAPPLSSPQDVAEQTLATITSQLPDGAVSVAVRDEDSGATFVYGAPSGMWTGSVYKLLVLETLLLERQQSGGWFSRSELIDITAMMEKSDNKAGYRMFLDAGGSAALAATAHRLRMRHTKIGATDPTFTTTSGADGLKLLTCLVGDGPLTRHSQAFTLSLMRSVQADQRWGAGVLADPGTPFANKNGWIPVSNGNGPGEDDGGRWAVNSVGIVQTQGRQLLVSIFTEHNTDFASGVRLVERLASAAAPAVLPVP